VATQQKKARRSSRCGPCFPLHQQLVCLLGLGLTGATAPQKKVATKKVWVEPRRVVAPRGDLWSEPQGRKVIQLAQMTEES